MKQRKRKTVDPCQGCFLHLNYCICDQLFKIDIKTRVDLVVHYKELKRTTNSGRLIERTLKNQRVWTRGLEGAPLDHGQILQKEFESVLLYPCEEAEVLTEDWAELNKKTNKQFQLIVPDGNWRQASKVHYRVSEFKSLRRVTLPEDLADQVSLLRQETKPNGMSTLEAIGYALGVLEDKGAEEHILKAYKIKKNAVLRSRGLKAN